MLDALSCRDDVGAVRTFHISRSSGILRTVRIHESTNPESLVNYQQYPVTHRQNSAHIKLSKVKLLRDPKIKTGPLLIQSTFDKKM